MMTRKSSFIALVCLVTLLGLVSLAGAANEVFLSNDTAESEATYVVQFEATVKGNIDQIHLTLPSGTSAANAALGRLLIGDKVFEADDVQLSVDLLDPNTLIVDLKDERDVNAGTKILVELFNLNNPVAGDHAIEVKTIDRKSTTLDMISIAYSTFNLSLPNVIIGASNTAIGTSALSSNTTGSRNTASGVNALLSNTTGRNNTASGADALLSNTTGFTNTASGANALLSNTNGIHNTASGGGALANNTSGSDNTASGVNALLSNTTGSDNTAIGFIALRSNTTGSNNTAIGNQADVSTDNLTNATAIGANAIVNASNKVRIGNASVTVIEGQVAFSASSDKTKKENFKPVDGEEVLKKIRGLGLTSWNFIGHDPKQFRHYGPMAQDFFAAFGNDGVGTIGTPTTINSGDMAGILMIAVQALEKQNREVKAENVDLKARLERLERTILAKETLAQR